MFVFYTDNFWNISYYCELGKIIENAEILDNHIAPCWPAATYWSANVLCGFKQKTKNCLSAKLDIAMNITFMFVVV